MSDKRIAVVIFMTAFVVFTIGLESLEFIRLDCRFGIFTKEMLENGMTFFPTVYGKAYPDYPAPQTVLMYLSSLLRGEVSMLTTTIPSAIAGALMLAFIYLTGALHSRRLGIYGVLFTLGTYAFIFAVRTPSTDIFVAMLATISFYAVYSAEQSGKNGRLLFIPLAFILGFAFRGPIGLVIPAAVVFACYLVNMKIRKAIVTGVVAAGCMLLCMAALYFAAKYQGGKEFADAMLDSQIHGRMEKQRSLLYYFYKAFGVYSLSYTFAFVLVVLNAKRIFNLKNQEKDLLMIRGLLAWGLIILIGLSIPGTKHTRYILPAAPAFALIAAFIFARTDKALITAPLRIALSWISRVLPFLLTALLISAGIILGLFSITLSLNLNIAFVIILFTLVALSIFFCWSRFKDSEDRDMIAFSHGIISFLILIIFIVEPIQQWAESSKEFVKKTEETIDASSPVYFYRIGPDGEDLKYIVNVKRRLKPEFISSEEDISTLKPKDIIILTAKDFEAISEAASARFITIYSGKMGHERFVSVKIKADTAVQK